MGAPHRIRRVPPADLGPLLHMARLRARLTVTEAARRAGVDRSYLSNLEAGRRVPSAAYAAALADVLVLTDDERARLLEVAVGDAGRSHPARRTS